jgi:hypothetical protein
MSWSFRIFQIAGVGVYLHLTFILLLVVVGFAEVSASDSVLTAVIGILSFLALFACVLAHEFGHILMARHFGVGTRDVTLLPIGGVARLEKIPEKPSQELWVALAGPAVNVVIVCLLFIWILLGRGSKRRFSKYLHSRGGRQSNDCQSDHDRIQSATGVPHGWREGPEGFSGITDGLCKSHTRLLLHWGV